MQDWLGENTSYVLWVATLGAAYLLGAIPSGLVIGRCLAGVDLRESGSGNIGATNALRVLGRWPALAVLFIDFSKAAAAVMIAQIIGAPAYVWAGAAVAGVVGHCWSAYIGFRGGKGAACALGAGIILFWPAGVVGAALAALVTGLTRYASLGSLVGTIGGALTICVAVAWGMLPPGIILVLLVPAVVIYRHRDNLRRLRTGTERKLGAPGHRRVPARLARRGPAIP